VLKFIAIQVRLNWLTRSRFPLPARDLCRLLLLAGVIAVSWLALTPRPPSLADTGWDKVNHVLAFTALAAVAWFGFPASRAPAMATLLGYGGLIEVAQSFTPTRSAEWADLLADAAGIACGSLLAAAAAAAGRWRAR
jgi:VanZ family protein